MPLFQYSAKSAPGDLIKGEMSAENPHTLAARLNEMGLFPVDISPVPEQQVVGQTRLKYLFRKSMRTALIGVTRQLANMLQAGMSIYSAVLMLYQQASDGMIKQVLQDLLQRLRDGQPFSEACAAWPAVFSPFYISMIRAGETGGMLELVFDHLAMFMEKEDEIKKQIQSALAYPLLMIAMGIATVSLLLTFVVPSIVNMFDEIGQSLPLPTRILVTLSGFMANYGWLVFILIISAALYLKSIWNAPAFKDRFDLLKLRLPLIGNLIRQAEVAQFAQTLSALFAHGVPIQQALNVVIASCKNNMIKKDFSQAAESIRQGKRIGKSLLQGRFLPAMLGQMIAIAEDTNQLETVLDRIAASSAKEVERKLTLFTKLLEPAMIILIGSVIGFIVFAMMLPIFQIDFVVQ